jgi:hypothetical protein
MAGVALQDYHGPLPNCCTAKRKAVSRSYKRCSAPCRQALSLSRRGLYGAFGDWPHPEGSHDVIGRPLVAVELRVQWRTRMQASFG